MTEPLTIFFCLFLSYKKAESLLPGVCSVMYHGRHQNMLRTSVTHTAAPHAPLSCSYQILMSSVISYRAETQQHGNYSLNGE